MAPDLSLYILTRLIPHVPSRSPSPMFIHPLQVYGIIAAQLVLTTLVAAVVVANKSVQQFVVQSWGLQIALLLVSILALIPLYIWRHSHPTNLALLGVWTCIFSGAQAACGLEGGCAGYVQSGCGRQGGEQARSARVRPPCCIQPCLSISACPLPTTPAVTVGMACSFYQPAIVLEALLITAAVVRMCPPCGSLHRCHL